MSEVGGGGAIRSDAGPARESRNQLFRQECQVSQAIGKLRSLSLSHPCLQVHVHDQSLRTSHCQADKMKWLSDSRNERRLQPIRSRDLSTRDLLPVIASPAASDGDGEREG